MNYFLWAVFAALAFDAISNVFMLGTGIFPPRTRGTTWVNLIANIALLGCVLALLIGTKQ